MVTFGPVLMCYVMKTCGDSGSIRRLFLKVDTAWIWVHSCTLTWFYSRRGISKTLWISGNPGRPQKYPLTWLWLGSKRANRFWLTLQATLKQFPVPLRLVTWNRERLRRKGKKRAYSQQAGMLSTYNLIAKRNLRGKSLVSTEECFLRSGSGLVTTYSYTIVVQ